MENSVQGEAAEKDILYDFSEDINPMGINEAVFEAWQEAAAFGRSPDRECTALREVIAAAEGVQPQNIICGNGAAELILLAVLALRPKSALITAPDFQVYENALRYADCAVDIFYAEEENGFEIPQDFADNIGEHGIVFLSCPCGVPGGLIPMERLMHFARVCKEKGAALILDMSLMDFCGEREDYSCTELINAGCTVIKDLSKAFGTGSAYLVSAAEDILEKLSPAGQFLCVGATAQAAGMAALGETSFVSKTAGYAAREKRYLSENLDSFCEKIFLGHANSLLVKSGLPLNDILIPHGIKLGSCDDIRGLGKGYFRIAVRSHEDNLRLINALKKELVHDEGGNEKKDYSLRWRKLFVSGRE